MTRETTVGQNEGAEPDRTAHAGTNPKRNRRAPADEGDTHQQMTILESLRTVGQTLKRPEYTGENRCAPCTVLNGGISVAVAAAVGVFEPVLAGLVLVVAALAIYFRGYLVPGTPTLTARYLPDEVHRALGHRDGPARADGGAVDEEELTDAERRFLEVGVLVERPDGELELAEGFRAAWRDRIAQVREDESAQRQALAELLGTDPDGIEIDVIEPVCFGFANGKQIGQWPSRPALVADVTAAPELATELPDWEDLDFLEQGVLLNSLRVFLRECPACDGPVELRGSSRVDCCGDVKEQYSMECENCGVPLL